MVGLPGQTGEVTVERGWKPPSAMAPPPKREPPAFVEGDTVMHERWGEGVVVQVSGHGDDAEATIRFGDIGEKRVLLAYAPLTKVG